MPDTFVVSTSGGGQTRCDPGNKMTAAVARIVGGEDEPLVRGSATAAINRVRLRLNGMDWNFTKTTNSDITLVDGTQTYSLSTSFKKPSFAILRDTNSKPGRTLEYKDDAWLADWLPVQTETGDPLYYTLRNAQEDGLISLYPVPETSAAANWTLQVEFYKRIPVINDNTDEVDLPEEVCNVFVMGGQYYLLMERDKGSQMIPIARQDYEIAIKELQTYDRRIHDEYTRFRLSRGGQRELGSVLIRVK